MYKKTFVKAVAALLALLLLSGCAAAELPNDSPNIIDGENVSVNGVRVPVDGDIMKANSMRKTFELVKTDGVIALSASDVGDDTAARTLAQHINDFGYRLTAMADDGGSFVFSPFSVYAALASLSNGATGTAYDQMQAALYPQGISRDEFNKAAGELLALLVSEPSHGLEQQQYEFAIATLVTVDEKYYLDEDFAETAKKSFRADVAKAKFSQPDAKDYLNEWAAEATRGLIPQLFSDAIDPDTAVILMNSVYFHGGWVNKFYDGLTEEEVFHGKDGDRNVQMMQREGITRYFENEMLQSVRMYYRGGAFMDVYLPKEGYSPEEVLASLGELDAEYSDYQGLLKLPRFKTEYGVELDDAIKNLGMTDIYSGGLEKLAVGPFDIELTSVFQKAAIEVDEEGTTAAAVTALIASATGMPVTNGTFEMICDRPFIYSISVDMGEWEQVLFVGAER